MRGLKSEDLSAMIDFLYSGEANVLQENLDSFLALADELQLKGFTGQDWMPQQKVPSSENVKQFFKGGFQNSQTSQKYNRGRGSKQCF